MVSNRIYNIPIDLEPNRICLILNQSENGEYNLIPINLTRIIGISYDKKTLFKIIIMIFICILDNIYILY